MTLATGHPFSRAYYAHLDQVACSWQLATRAVASFLSSDVQEPGKLKVHTHDGRWPSKSSLPPPHICFEAALNIISTLGQELLRLAPLAHFSSL